jgi:glycerol-3-phosphate dehydrogenase (NAD(P)+)
MSEIAVVGAGAWGTALAVLAARRGHDVILWAYAAGLAAEIGRARENVAYLPGVSLEATIRVTSVLEQAAAAPLVLLAVPAQHLRGVCRTMAGHLRGTPALVICAKGIEVESGELMSEVVGTELPGAKVAVLTGPTFAAEVARDLPTAVTVACADAERGAAIVAALGGATFRPYLTDDVIGAQVGGAVKNVLAIACGIAFGRGFGDNARAALITRGLAEIGRLSVALGGRPETLMGLSGVGDVTLTCTSTQSRNYTLGVALGEGRRLAALLADRITVAEGVPSARAVAVLAARKRVDMPIALAVDAVLHHGADLDREIGAVLARPFRSEVERV